MPKKGKSNIVELRRVSFAYGDISVLENLSFSVERGDFMGVIGPNGGGKTTAIKLILGLLRPDAGSIRLFGVDSRDFGQRYRIGYVAQDVRNFDRLFPATVLEVVLMGRFARAGLVRRVSSHDRKVARKALRDVGMDDLRLRRIGELSGGQQQRVFIARALAAEPDLLILDEPTAGVDPRTEHAFYDLLHELNEQQGMTLMLVSHDISVVTNHVNKITCVSKGLCYHGPAKGFTHKKLVEVYGENMKVLVHKH